MNSSLISEVRVEYEQAHSEADRGHWWSSLGPSARSCNTRACAARVIELAPAEF